jgi:hypothetical protein
MWRVWFFPGLIGCLHENRRFGNKPDASPGLLDLAEFGEDAQDYILGYSQPSLAGLFLRSDLNPGLPRISCTLL